MITQSEMPRTKAEELANSPNTYEHSYNAMFQHAVKLEREVTALTAQLAEARTIAWDWGQGVDDAKTAIRKLSRMFPIDTIKEPK